MKSSNWYKLINGKWLHIVNCTLWRTAWTFIELKYSFCSTRNSKQFGYLEDLESKTYNHHLHSQIVCTWHPCLSMFVLVFCVVLVSSYLLCCLSFPSCSVLEFFWWVADFNSQIASTIYLYQHLKMTKCWRISFCTKLYNSISINYNGVLECQLKTFSVHCRQRSLICVYCQVSLIFRI